jgi:enediyne biosynthesis protein E4
MSGSLPTKANGMIRLVREACTGSAAHHHFSEWEHPSYFFVGCALSLCVLILASTGCDKAAENKNKIEVELKSLKVGSQQTKIVQGEPIFQKFAGTDEVFLAQETGHTAESRFMPEIMAGGAAFLDFDNDGRLDIYFVNGNFEHSISGSSAPNKTIQNQLYHQQPDGSFKNVTEASGLGDAGYGMGCGVGDINNDGFVDVYVSNYAADRLFLNNKNGTFTDITESAGIDNIRWGASVAMLDFDRDGWLDIFVTNYLDYFASRACSSRNGKPDYCGPTSFKGVPDRLFRNITGDVLKQTGSVSEATANVKFQDVSLDSGIGKIPGPGLGAAVIDANRDGWPDIYVANDQKANFLWINQQNGTFADEAVQRGVALDVQGREQAGMGLAIDDIDRNGWTDILVTHFTGEYNALYMGDQKIFKDKAMTAGVGAASYQFTGFGTAFCDFDNDGDMDLTVVNGKVSRPRTDAGSNADDASAFWNGYAEPNHYFQNQGTGKFDFYQSTDDAFLSGEAVSRALCVGDVNSDGKPDVLVTRLQSKPLLLENRAKSSGNYLVIEARLPQFGGRHDYGALLQVNTSGPPLAHGTNPAGSYLSSHDPNIHFGLGSIDKVDSLTVTWYDGKQERFAVPKINARLRVEYGTGEPLEKTAP